MDTLMTLEQKNAWLQEWLEGPLATALGTLRAEEGTPVVLMIGRGRLLHRTWSMAFCEGAVVGAKGELIAHATGTFKYLEGLPAGGRTIKRQNASD